MRMPFARRDDILPMFVIYDHPTDWPDEVVCRIVEVGNGGLMPHEKLFARGPDVASVRSQLPPGLWRIPADAGDDPAIVETWI